MYKTTYAFVILYIVTITFAKMSILLFYRRVFGASIIWYIVFVLACLHGAEVRITWLCGCRPVSYFWESYTDPDAVGSCIDDPLFWFITRLIGLFIDIAVLLVPVPIIYKLQMPPKKKLMVYGILLLGSSSASLVSFAWP